MGWYPPPLPVRPVFPALTRHVDRKLPACEPVVGEPAEVVGVVVVGEVEDAPALEVLKNPLHRSSPELK